MSKCSAVMSLFQSGQRISMTQEAPCIVEGAPFANGRDNADRGSATVYHLQRHTVSSLRKQKKQSLPCQSRDRCHTGLRSRMLKVSPNRIKILMRLSLVILRRNERYHPQETMQIQLEFKNASKISVLITSTTMCSKQNVLQEERQNHTFQF